MKKKIFFILLALLGISQIVCAAPKMQLAPTSTYSYPNSYAYEYTLTTIAASTSTWVQVPAGIKSVSVTLILTGGAKAKVQTTTDSVYRIETASASVVGVDWNYGVCSVNSQDTANAITAYRLIQTASGRAVLTARAQ
jgi:hypothetical protein